MHIFFFFLNWYFFEIINSKAKENVFSRAYLNFKNIETLVEFFKEFDGHLYIDSKGKIINNIFFIQKKKKKKKKNWFFI